jgi:hypothetical protein
MSTPGESSNNDASLYHGGLKFLPRPVRKAVPRKGLSIIAMAVTLLFHAPGAR